ncbi:pyridine nucleotide-disulfide oxidoreductase [Bacillus sp. LL01]|uniref:FAD-dependent oxidoreductase n=1 Tax=Bacillus sp. LL01 TaxID=1665556 RepID=UPI00064D672E|nr:FAD-dependent oxidoreductase [Bacillus sp. LL01]KMJ57948.1 pyridine nucleotide-disulfide oxidoreductase [Bacillus sp. LL01]
MTIVLVGGGHAHLKCLTQIKKDIPLSDQTIILISPDQYQYYSGMFSGFTEGIYSLDEIRIDLKKLADDAGVVLLQEKIIEVSSVNKTLITENGTIIPFDVVSFDIGSYMEAPSSFERWLVPLKPNYLFAEKMKAYRKQKYPVVVGGGASGVEIALAITAWRKKNGYPLNVTLISSSRLLPSSSQKAGADIKKVTVNKGVRVIEGDRVAEIYDTHCKTEKGLCFPHSHLLWLTGPKASDIFLKSSLPCDEDGFLLVESSLQASGIPFMFGAGDCITLKEYPHLAKNGVYAVRQGELLSENIFRFLNGEVCLHFSPQRHFLSLISSGNREALLQYARFSTHSKLNWLLKNTIDKRFMKKHK